MGRMLIGAAIFGIGLGTFLIAASSEAGGVYWSGGMICGGLLFVSGAYRYLRRKLKRQPLDDDVFSDAFGDEATYFGDRPAAAVFDRAGDEAVRSHREH